MNKPAISVGARGGYKCRRALLIVRFESDQILVPPQASTTSKKKKIIIKWQEQQMEIRRTY